MYVKKLDFYILFGLIMIRGFESSFSVCYASKTNTQCEYDAHQAAD